MQERVTVLVFRSRGDWNWVGW